VVVHGVAPEGLGVEDIRQPVVGKLWNAPVPLDVATIGQCPDWLVSSGKGQGRMEWTYGDVQWINGVSQLKRWCIDSARWREDRRRAVDLDPGGGSMITESGDVMAVGLGAMRGVAVRGDHRFSARYLYISGGRAWVTMRARGQSGVAEEAHGPEATKSTEVETKSWHGFPLFSIRG
jgi:hypothetical protein